MFSGCTKECLVKRYQNLTEEGKNQKPEHGGERHKNLWEKQTEKQRLVTT